CMQGLEFSFTF
nr:immunoglobulin light chain junction region [Macaca mulatta]